MAVHVFKLIKNKTLCVSNGIRLLSHFYPTDDNAFGLTETQIKLRSRIFNIAQNELAPYAKEIDKKDKFDDLRAFWKKLGQLGLLGITVNSEYGGADGLFLDHVIIIEELSRACTAIAMSYGAHSGMCINQIYRNGNEFQKRKYLPKLCSGEHIGALAVAESTAGSDILSMKLRAYKEDNYYVLNGHKLWTTNGSDADIFVVYAKTDLNIRRQEGISAFIIENQFKGFSTGQSVVDKLGLRGSSNCEILFKDCKVPIENLLGYENEGVNVLMSGLALERLILAAGPLGIMQACCDIAFSSAQNRNQNPKTSNNFQLIQGKMADMYTSLSACRSYLYNIARACDNGYFTAKDCAGVMLYCSESATRMALDAIQILGENGYRNEYPTTRYLRDAKITEIAAGTSEIRKLVIGRAINFEYSA